MNFADFWKNHKTFIVCAIIVVLFFLALLADNHFKLYKMERDYEKQIRELKDLVQVTNIGEQQEIEFDVYQTAEDFLNCYYGVSADMPKEYRDEKLKELMTEEAYVEYGETDYDNTQNYTITLSNICIYVDSQHSTKGESYVCIFFDENIDWPEINTITLHKYWRGIFSFDYASKRWLLSEISDFQELLTREEYNALNTDTNGSEFEDSMTEGGGEDADTGKKE